MLPLTDILQENEIKAAYNADWAQHAVDAFCEELLPAGKDAIKDALRQAALRLYRDALGDTGKTIFLDKTPRYYHILPQLQALFPDAQYIFLFRNPLAVLASIIDTWVHSDWLYLAHYRHDLLHAPKRLIEGRDRLGDSATSLRYEDLVTSPDAALKSLCGEIGLNYESRMVQYGNQSMTEWKMGDPASVYQRQRPDPTKVDQWIDRTQDPQAWRLLEEYLAYLGDDTLSSMGYVPETLSEQTKSARLSSGWTVSLRWLLSKDYEDRSPWERRLIQKLNTLRSRGLFGAVASSISRRLSS